jgi:hypothetical protein
MMSAGVVPATAAGGAASLFAPEWRAEYLRLSVVDLDAADLATMGEAIRALGAGLQIRRSADHRSARGLLPRGRALLSRLEDPPDPVQGLEPEAIGKHRRQLTFQRFVDERDEHLREVADDLDDRVTEVGNDHTPGIHPGQKPSAGPRQSLPPDRSGRSRPSSG